MLLILFEDNLLANRDDSEYNVRVLNDWSNFYTIIKGLYYNRHLHSNVNNTSLSANTFIEFYFYMGLMLLVIIKKYIIKNVILHMSASLF